MHRIPLSTEKKREVIDITDIIRQEFHKNYPNVSSGLLQLFLPHTSAAITIAAMDAGTDQDYINVFDAMVPKIKFENVNDPETVPSRIIASVIKPGFAVPVSDHEMQLGMWQRIILIELNGPHEREILMTFLPTDHS